MVEEQLAARGIRNSRVLEAMGKVPRERFVSSAQEPYAYDDGPLPIGEGQTISQPYVVALMIESLGLSGGEKVLEVGTGSGYAAAVLACIAGEVHSVERIPALAARARLALRSVGCDRVIVHDADGTMGWEDAAPYDAILVSAAAVEIPRALEEQLAPGGTMVIPVGRSAWAQVLLRVRKDEDGGTRIESLGEVRFVPLIAEEASPSGGGTSGT
jgi:protein-L-isoaspartate(D-aspartate) O-methyltransferase